MADSDCIACSEGDHSNCVFTHGGAGPCGCADRGHLKFGERIPPDMSLGKSIHDKPSNKKQGRNTRWQDAARKAVEAFEELVSLKEEYQEWYDNTPDNLQQSPMGEKLDAIISIDVEGGLDIANECEGADLPLGFGRD